MTIRSLGQVNGIPYRSFWAIECPLVELVSFILCEIEVDKKSSPGGIRCTSYSSRQFNENIVGRNIPMKDSSFVKFTVT